MDTGVPPTDPQWLFTGDLHMPRQPPHSPEAEVAYLGALLHNNKVLDKTPYLRPHHFANPVNARVFEEITKLIEQNRTADAVTLKSIFDGGDALKEVGGHKYLTQLLASMIGIINAGDYGRVIRENWMRRQMIESAQALIDFAYNPSGVDPTELALQAVEELDEIIVGQQTASSMVSLNVAMDSAIEAMDAAGKAGGPPGIRSGFRSVDARIGGFEAGLVYVLAGATGAGKSTLGHQFVVNAARTGHPVLSLALEMTRTQLGRRTLSVVSGVPNFVMRRGNPSLDDGQRIAKARKELHDLPLIIDDAAGQTMRQMAATIRAARRRLGGLSMIALDHLNLVRADGKDASHGPTHSTSLAADMVLQIAKDEGVAFLEMVQLSRGVESREDHRPLLSDLRQSGTIEQNAFAVCFVYREEQYIGGMPERSEKETGEQHGNRITAWESRNRRCRGTAELIWSKIRDAGEAGLGSDPLLFDGPTTMFSEPTGDYL